MWYKTESLKRPSLTDSTSSRIYNYARRDIVEKQRVDEISGERITYYEYEESKIRKEEWGLFLDIRTLEQTAADNEEALCDIDESYNQRLADIEDALCELAEMLSE